MDRYTLGADGKTPVREPDLMKWAEWFETANRRVAWTEVGKAKVSTVFLALDHSFSRKGPPILFETMVFREEGNETDCERCSTWEEAERQHEAMVEKVRSTQN